MENQKVWFVTGASKGLGLSLVKQLLNAGYKVAATSRNAKDLTDAVGSAGESFLPLMVNLVLEDSVAEAINATVAKFGRIDVIVNNAAYGLTGGLEELTDQEARDNFDVNIFGSLNVIRKALPFLRNQESGHIINIASIAGFTGMVPGFGILSATKFAVHGFTESLFTEVKDFGIQVTVVSPGYFRTSFLAPESLSVPKQPIETYKAVRETQKMHQTTLNGTQAGDPEKAASTIIKITEAESPPLHLFLGEDAYTIANQKIEQIQLVSCQV